MIDSIKYKRIIRLDLIISFLILVCICMFFPDCNYANSSNISLKDDKNKLDTEMHFENVKTIVNNNYKIELITSLINDTLSGKWEDDIYGSPLVEKQQLKFYVNGNELKSHFFPIGHIKKTTTNKHIVNVVRIPILEICLLKSNNEYLYYISGADFCNGVGCPEFTGLYTMQGSTLYEGISTIGPLSKKYCSLETIINKYNLDINNPDTCQSLMNIWSKQ